MDLGLKSRLNESENRLKEETETEDVSRRTISVERGDGLRSRIPTKVVSTWRRRTWHLSVSTGNHRGTLLWHDCMLRPSTLPSFWVPRYPGFYRVQRQLNEDFVLNCRFLCSCRYLGPRDSTWLKFLSFSHRDDQNLSIRWHSLSPVYWLRQIPWDAKEDFPPP